MISIVNLKKGDLCAYSGYLGKLYSGIYAGEGSNSLQFWSVTQRTVDRLKEGKKPYVDYISGSHTSQRVVRITEDELDTESKALYQEIKQL